MLAVARLTIFNCRVTGSGPSLATRLAHGGHGQPGLSPRGWAPARTRPASGGAVLRTGHWRAGRSPAPGQAAQVPHRGRGRGEGADVRDARRERDAPGPLGPPGTGPPRGSRRIAPAPSASTVRRWLADDTIKPWQHRSWIFPGNPRFSWKDSRVLNLYQREREGRPLGEDNYVLGSDEKPGVQARMRLHLTLPRGQSGYALRKRVPPLRHPGLLR
jgi:hypothetical protein